MPRGLRLPKTPANELKLNLFEFLQRVQQRFNKVNGNKRLANGIKPIIINKLQTASTPIIDAVSFIRTINKKKRPEWGVFLFMRPPRSAVR